MATPRNPPPARSKKYLRVIVLIRLTSTECSHRTAIPPLSFLGARALSSQFGQICFKPVKDPFGVQALACPDRCSLKAELRTCAPSTFMRFGCAPAHVRLRRNLPYLPDKDELV